MRGRGPAHSCGCCYVDHGNRLAGLCAGTSVSAAAGDSQTSTGVCSDESRAAVHKRPSDDEKGNIFFFFT